MLPAELETRQSQRSGFGRWSRRLLLIGAVACLLLSWASGQLPKRLVSYPSTWDLASFDAARLEVDAADQNRSATPTRLAELVPLRIESREERLQREAPRREADRGLLLATVAWMRFEWVNLGGMRVTQTSTAIDPTFLLDGETFDALVEGIPMPWWNCFVNASSKAHALEIRGRLLAMQPTLDQLHVVEWKHVSRWLLCTSIGCATVWIGLSLIGPIRRAYRPAAVRAIKGAMAARSHLDSLVSEATRETEDAGKPKA